MDKKKKTVIAEDKKIKDGTEILFVHKKDKPYFIIKTRIDMLNKTVQSFSSVK